jgi:hypothetical protein
MREAMREKVKRHSLWYLVEGGGMIVTGILALVYPVVSSFAAVRCAFDSPSRGRLSRNHASAARVLHG